MTPRERGVEDFGRSTLARNVRLTSFSRSKQGDFPVVSGSLEIAGSRGRHHSEPKASNCLSVHQQGWLRIYILYVEGKPVAFWKGTLYGNCLQSDHVGFDSSWPEFPLECSLPSCRDSQVEVIDFGTGNGQLYQCFAGRQRSEARAQIFAPRFTGLKLNLRQTLTRTRPF
jgi:hypothetical protein